MKIYLTLDGVPVKDEASWEALSNADKKKCLKAWIDKYLIYVNMVEENTDKK